jgi:N-acetyl-anhydromuramyl-L-alanine amidase AmpD
VTLTLVGGLAEMHDQPDPMSDIRKIASRANDHGPRPWSRVTGICLHQTACLLGERPARWSTVGAHVGVTRSGRVMWIQNFDRVVWHGNGWNRGTVGIEIDGLYAGVEGDPATVWDDPSTPQHEQAMTLTPEAVQATQQAIRWICSVVAKHRGKVTALVAHRQSSGSRRNDPGSAIWHAVALPMHAELGLGDGGPGFKLGTGRPVPEAWDAAGHKGEKY